MEEKQKRNVYDVLAQVQHKVSCPKGKTNKFGGYAYRSLEDINAALKPVCEELRCGYHFEDEIVHVDGERWYINAKVRFWAEDADGFVQASALAREQDGKKGMDDAQVTGLASSYARKYAACALFAIDSGEEVDAMDNAQGSQRSNKGAQASRTARTTKKAATPAKNPSRPATADQVNELSDLLGEFANIKSKTMDEVLKAVNTRGLMVALGVKEDTCEYTEEQAETAIGIVKAWIEKSK